ncbi:hypothetical protein U2F10_08030 [Leptothoe sp. EHU-05/26/07-4]
MSATEYEKNKKRRAVARAQVFNPEALRGALRQEKEKDQRADQELQRAQGRRRRRRLENVDPLEKRKLDLHAFFNWANWWQNLDRISISASGAKGGVVFVDFSSSSSKGRLVVKFTDVPQQVLFAEHVLQELGRAKTTTPLIIPLQSADKSDIEYGEKIIQHIKQEIKKELNASATTEKQKEKQRKYKDYEANLNKAKYLIVMKCLEGDMLSEIGDLTDWLEDSSDYPDYSINDKSKANIITKDELKIVIQKKHDLKKIIFSFYKNKEILADENLMISVGRILAVDCLLGNGDRFGPKFNVGNAIYMKKVGQIGRTIGVIDNDAFLPICKKDNLHRLINIWSKNEKTSIGKYLSFILDEGCELVDDKGVDITFPSLKKILKDFKNNWFKEVFYGKFYPELSGKYLPQIYYDILEDDGSLINQPKKYQSFPKIDDNKDFRIQIPWFNAYSSILQGFSEVIDIIQSDNGTLIRSFYEKYDELLGKYRGTQNFDWTAFQVRWSYISLVVNIKKVYEKPKRFEYLNHDNAIKEIKLLIPSIVSRDYLTSSRAEKQLSADKITKDALGFCFRQNLIDKATKEQIAETLNSFGEQTKKRFIFMQKTGVYQQELTDTQNMIINFQVGALLKIFNHDFKNSLTIEKAPKNMTEAAVVELNLARIDYWKRVLEDTRFQEEDPNSKADTFGKILRRRLWKEAEFVGVEEKISQSSNKGN